MTSTATPVAFLKFSKSAGHGSSARWRSTCGRRDSGAWARGRRPGSRAITAVARPRPVTPRKWRRVIEPLRCISWSTNSFAEMCRLIVSHRYAPFSMLSNGCRARTWPAARNQSSAAPNAAPFRHEARTDMPDVGRRPRMRSAERGTTAIRCSSPANSMVFRARRGRSGASPASRGPRQRHRPAARRISSGRSDSVTASRSPCRFCRRAQRSADRRSLCHQLAVAADGARRMKLVLPTKSATKRLLRLVIDLPACRAGRSGPHS